MRHAVTPCPQVDPRRCASGEGQQVLPGPSPGESCLARRVMGREGRESGGKLRGSSASPSFPLLSQEPLALSPQAEEVAGFHLLHSVSPWRAAEGCMAVGPGNNERRAWSQEQKKETRFLATASSPFLPPIARPRHRPLSKMPGFCAVRGERGKREG